MNLPQVREGKASSQKVNRFQQLKVERQAHFERLWLLEENPFFTHPVWFERCVSFLNKQLTEEHQVVADLGCGNGEVARRLLQLGKEVDAVDIAKNALKKIRPQEGLRVLHDYMPKTCLHDSTYDAIVAFDLIGSFEQEEYRMFFSELARIGKRDSLAVVSTPFDSKTERGLERFLSLFSTEYELLDLECGYLKFQPPSLTLTRGLEKVRKFCLAERGVTHVIASGKRRRLV